MSPNTVSDVATGKRAAITLSRPKLNEGETFLAEGIRCSVCKATISVIPCRACGAAAAKGIVESVHIPCSRKSVEVCGPLERPRGLPLDRQALAWLD